MEMAKISLIEVIIGIWILAALVILGGVWFVPNPLAYVLGEVVGSLTASLMMLHLYHTLSYELDLAQKKATNHARIMISLRTVIEIAVLVGSFYIEEWVLPYTVLIGLFGRKFAPMLVPFMERLRRKGE